MVADIERLVLEHLRAQPNVTDSIQRLTHLAGNLSILKRQLGALTIEVYPGSRIRPH
ncbi:hypothetical protein [Thiohalocapsa halophila]